MFANRPEMYSARIGRLEHLWSVHHLARAVTKGNTVSHKRWARLTSCIHFTCGYRQYCHFGNTAAECSLGLSKTPTSDSKPTSGGMLCTFWKQHICADQLVLRKKRADSCCTQQHRRRYDVIGRLSKIGRNSCTHFVDTVIDVLELSAGGQSHAKQSKEKEGKRR